MKTKTKKPAISVKSEEFAQLLKKYDIRRPSTLTVKELRDQLNNLDNKFDNYPISLELMHENMEAIVAGVNHAHFYKKGEVDDLYFGLVINSNYLEANYTVKDIVKIYTESKQQFDFIMELVDNKTVVKVLNKLEGRS